MKLCMGMRGHAGMQGMLTESHIKCRATHSVQYASLQLGQLLQGWFRSETLDEITPGA
jgi:hypothetical protein